MNWKKELKKLSFEYEYVDRVNMWEENTITTNVVNYDIAVVFIESLLKQKKNIIKKGPKYEKKH